jgi:hypothetical protein
MREPRAWPVEWPVAIRLLGRWHGRSRRDPRLVSRSPQPRGAGRRDTRSPLELPSGANVAPDEPSLARRWGIRRQRPDPIARRCRETSLEDFRIARHQGAVASGRSHHPHGADLGVRPPSSDRQVLEFGPFPIRRPRRRADVAERIPALHEEHPAPRGGRETDIYRPPWLAGPRWQLERPGIAGPAPEAKNEFLNRSVAGVRRWLEGVPPECDDRRPAESDPDALEDIKVEVGDTAFDPALDHPADPRPSGQLRARPTPALAHGPNLAADPSPLILVSPGRLDRELGASDTGHDRHMFIPRSSPALTNDLATATLSLTALGLGRALLMCMKGDSGSIHHSATTSSRGQRTK